MTETHGKPVSAVTEPLVLTDVEKGTGLIGLNRPRALNSLNPEMITVIDSHLRTWLENPQVEQVLLYSTSPKAFCSGGDVRYARDMALAEKHEESDAFFTQEYKMNGVIAHYPKPYISLLDGIVMGGGLGLSAHGSYRIVSEKALAAMPEMAIGYIPDVGMSWMFQHMVTQLGKPSYALAIFLVLTGYRLDTADMLFSGLGTQYVPSEHMDSFKNAVIAEGIEKALSQYEQHFDDHSKLADLMPDIEATFNHTSWEAIDQALENYPNKEFVSLVRDLMKGANPTSVVLTVQFMAQVAQLDSIDEELALEIKLCEVMRRSPNFSEGVRAVLVDKDQDAHFEPAHYSDVDLSSVSDLLS